MNKSSLNSFSIFLLFALSACIPKTSLDKRELYEYVNNPENGLVKESDALGVSYSLKYRPLDIILDQDVKSHPNCNQDSLRKNYEGSLYFVLSISRDSSDVLNAMSEEGALLLNKIAFHLKENIFLFTDQSSAPFYLRDFIYPRLYGTTTATSILLCFREKEFERAAHFTICINNLFDQSDEKLKFDFFKNDIEQVPTLKL